MMNRTVLLRSFPYRATAPIKVNDLIGLDPHESYTLSEHLDDLAQEGVSVAEQRGSSLRFSNGDEYVYEEAEEPISLDLLDSITRALVLGGAGSALSGASQQVAYPAAFRN